MSGTTWTILIVSLIFMVKECSSAQCGHTCSVDDETLDCWRENIDYYSDIILEALNKRAIVANHIGEWKRKRNLPIVDYNRVGAVLNRIASRNPGPLTQSAIIKVFGAIVNETAAYEEAFTGKPAHYECQISSAQEPPSTLAYKDSAPLHPLLVAVLVVQVVIALLIFISVACVLHKIRSLQPNIRR